MIVTFISQCEKSALKRTRRVLDSFADRIGDSAWQTVITQDGLNAVKKLLRKNASKNTAVACHWVRSRSRTDLVWVIGRRSKFNQQGIVPVNRTKKNLLHSEWENSWSQAASIQIVAVLAALLHDIGKATVGFQKKLTTNKFSGGDPYRHEWISLRLFEAMIAGCNDDTSWLSRMADFSGYMVENPEWSSQMIDDTQTTGSSFGHLPPIAQLVAWLIVSHHRLPFYEEDYFYSDTRKRLKVNGFLLNPTMQQFYQSLSPVNGWVKNQKSCNERNDSSDFWQFKSLVVCSKSWQRVMTRWANKALLHAPLMSMSEKTISDPFIMHLARMCLMVGDHNYSSLAPDDTKRLKGDKTLKDQLIANTDFKTKEPKQALDEHLLGVAQFSARFAKLLPHFPKELPTVTNHAAFSRRTNIVRFQWQNKAYDLAKKIQVDTDKQGFFGVSMASTGCGKTLGNARIMSALAGPKRGVRFTIALGLRVLTLQTGLALREKLQLDSSSLAVLVGGAANRRLFELNQEQPAEDELSESGSESAAGLVKEIVDFDDCAIDSEELGTVVADKKARDLLYAPIVSCTVDHIMGASENTRGGRHIAPMLRLLTSDLVLDEPDDFDQNDLPALSRLVYLAGVFGSKVLLSSATLTPDLIVGLFKAYNAGRQQWNVNNSDAKAGIVCAWFDEFKQSMDVCVDGDSYSKAHHQFVKKRVLKLKNALPRRVADILPVDLPLPRENEKLHNGALSELLFDSAKKLHETHHALCNKTNKTVSVGLIRMANIRPMLDLAREMYCSTSTPDDTQMYICCYHSRQLLLLRNSLEAKLDRILNRKNKASIFSHLEIKQALQSSTAKHHVFIVLATPVAEVGRDHDYDWAIVEPSSMRSIIQLVGRVWRHRPEKVAKESNVLIMDCNIKALEAGSGRGVSHSVFSRPGFEGDDFLLSTHNLSDLVSVDQLKNVNSISRIEVPGELQPKIKLADLEHAVMADLLNNSKTNYVNAFWSPGTANQANVHLQKISPFRLQENRQQDYVCVPDEDNNSDFRFRYSEQAWSDKCGGDSVNSLIKYTDFLPVCTPVKPWLVSDIQTELELLALQLEEGSLYEVALRYATVQLDENDRGWGFHPWVGFWIN